MSDKVSDKKWFINEEGNVYDYDPATQEDDYPNDDHVAYDSQAEAEAVAEVDLVPQYDDVELDDGKVEISFLLKLNDVDSIADAIDLAAMQVARYGLDSLYLLATTTDGTQYVIHEGTITEATEIEREYNAAIAEEDEARG